MANCDRKLFNRLKEHIIALRQVSDIEPLNIECSSCQHKYQQQLTMDQTSFFEDAS